MNTKDLIEWLRNNSSGAYRPAAEAADRMEAMLHALQTFAACDLNEHNCSGFHVANSRIRNIAFNALDADDLEPREKRLFGAGTKPARRQKRNKLNP
jgi:hypothetical protein